MRAVGCFAEDKRWSDDRGWAHALHNDDRGGVLVEFNGMVDDNIYFTNLWGVMVGFNGVVDENRVSFVSCLSIRG